MFRQINKYWWCQIVGWSIYLLINLFFTLTNGVSIYSPYFWINALTLVLFAFFGVLSTHLFRTLIHQLNWVYFSIEKQIMLFLSLMIGSALTLYVGYYLVGGIWLKIVTTPVFVVIGSATVIALLWWILYFLWHYVEKNRMAQVDQLKLEATVKELELKTIKAQMNPHFIFNALNSIRALIDENPQRARTAITELSNILRSSMQTEKAETVSLENELNIVKDYLALELIRFEERLSVKYEIDPDTLELQVPPMMLQTLVENAIKHGISRIIMGGYVNIHSSIKGSQHIITIENTGQIVDDKGKGFGLQSTRQRLSLLFGSKASFEIRNKDEQTVEAKVVMPLL
ncbi:sensor histidine kinase [Chitinophaga silvatica]|uniref:Sensor histidine kinase n=1 Tax=Chitinophaga silvatica TaxID=2282649 RepID=A0A3E1YA48_9BACT|nr:histidine kinase [Chitinophaga silvatica]RFS22537.1 sensor histidine kinase [Chitinophaga silvatica]